MARSAASFNRVKPRYLPQPTVLVICEDSKSGLNYLKDAARCFRVNVKVDVTHCGKTDPLGIVANALSRLSEFDSVYCAIDRDQHPNFEEALDLAKTSKKITVIASYPSFEFWLLLHFKYSRKPYVSTAKKSSGDLVIKDLRACKGMHDYEKGKDSNIFELLEDRFEIARDRARKTCFEADKDGQKNPSTMLHELIDEFEKLSKPQEKNRDA